MEYQQQSTLANISSSQSAVANMQSNEEMQPFTNEMTGLRSALLLANKRTELYESNMDQVIKDSRRKVHEANQAKIESDLRIRNAEHEVTKRLEAKKHLKTEAIARLRLESSIGSSNRVRLEHYENLYESERPMANELRMELKNKDTILRKSSMQFSTAIGQSSAQLMIENVENQVEIEALRAQDLTSEVTEYMEQNIHLKDRVAKVGREARVIDPLHYRS